MRFVFLSLFAAFGLFGQYWDFAVTDDGRLYFSTSLARESGDSRSKIFQITSDGLELYKTGGEPADDPFGPGAIRPLTSGDGSIKGYAIHSPCRTGSCGFFGPRTVYHLEGIAWAPAPLFGLQISRSRRYLLVNGIPPGLQLHTLPEKTMRKIPEGFGGAGEAIVANNGAVLLQRPAEGGHLYYLALDGLPQAVAGTEDALRGALSPGGDWIAYERNRNGNYELVLTDARGAVHRILETVSQGLTAPWPLAFFAYTPTFANDGTLLYLAPAEDGRIQAKISGPGRESHWLTTIENGVQRAILSGNGEIAWLATYSGEILRVRTADGGTDVFIPETPFLSGISQTVMPGSLVRVFGTGLSERTRFAVDGREMKASEIREQSAAIQIPWQYPPSGRGASRLAIAGPESPFQQIFSIYVDDKPGISFERIFFSGQTQMAHQDFRGLVTEADPARPGETVHLFARNMGPVDQAVETGQRSPLNPPARVTTPMACYLFEVRANRAENPRGVPVPFAGLAGGLIGVYQIDVTIPADWWSGPTSLQCQMYSSDGLFRGDNTAVAIAGASQQP